MRTWITLISIPALLALAGCPDNDGIDTMPTASGPGITEVGADWDDGSMPATFKFMAGFAASPGQIIEIDIENASTAGDIANQLVEKWNEQLPGHTAELCGSDIVYFPYGTVGNIAVLDSDGTWRRIVSTSTQVLLGNGVKVKKVTTACPY